MLPTLKDLLADELNTTNWDDLVFDSENNKNFNFIRRVNTNLAIMFQKWGWISGYGKI
jgi:hypothetical protein